MTNTFNIAFDNGGGATLMTSDSSYCHHYDDMEQLSEDVHLLLAGSSTSDWDGNDPEFAINDDAEGYKWFSESDIKTIMDADDVSTSWRNVRDFFVTLGVKVSD